MTNRQYASYLLSQTKCVYVCVCVCGGGGGGGGRGGTYWFCSVSSSSFLFFYFFFFFFLSKFCPHNFSVTTGRIGPKFGDMTESVQIPTSKPYIFLFHASNDTSHGTPGGISHPL